MTAEQAELVVEVGRTGWGGAGNARGGVDVFAVRPHGNNTAMPPMPLRSQPTADSVEANQSS